MDRVGDLFFDREGIQVGDTWDPVLRTQLHAAEIYLILVSNHTAAAGRNGFMWEQEFPVARRRQIEDQAWIIPVILEDATTLLHRDEELRHLVESHCAPNPMQTLKQLHDDWYLKVAGHVQGACLKFHAQNKRGWNAPQELQARRAATKLLDALRTIADAGLPGIHDSRLKDAVMTVDAALQVRGATSPRSIRTAISVLDGLLANMPDADDAVIDTAGALVSRLRTIVQLRSPSLLEEKSDLTPAQEVQEEIREVVTGLNEATDAVCEIQETAADLAEQNQMRMEDAAEQAGAHITVARAACREAETDIRAISDEIAAVSTVSKSLGDWARDTGVAIASTITRAAIRFEHSVKRLACSDRALVGRSRRATSTPSKTGNVRPSGPMRGSTWDEVSFNPIAIATIDAIVSISSKGRIGDYGELVSDAAGDLSYGKHGVKLSSGALLKLIRRYGEAPWAQHAPAFSPFLAALKARDGLLGSNVGLRDLLRTAATDPSMRDAQDQFFVKELMSRPLKTFTDAGFHFPLTAGILCDSFARAEPEEFDAFVSTTNAAVRPSAETEKAWIRRYTDDAHILFARGKGDDNSEAEPSIETWREQIDLGNWELALPIDVKRPGGRIYSLTPWDLNDALFTDPLRRLGAPSFGIARENAWSVPNGRDRFVRTSLIALGFLKGTADGAFGPSTTKAVKDFQTAMRLRDTGIVDERTFDRMCTEVEIHGSRSG